MAVLRASQRHLSKARSIRAIHVEKMESLGTMTLAKETVTDDNRPSEAGDLTSFPCPAAGTALRYSGWRNHGGFRVANGNREERSVGFVFRECKETFFFFKKKHYLAEVHVVEGCAKMWFWRYTN